MADRPSPTEQADRVAKVARSSEPNEGVVSAMRRDVEGMNPKQRTEFFQGLAAKSREGGGTGLPGLEITGSPAKHNLRVGYPGQAPMYQERDAATVGKGEGPYGAVKRQHPDWKHEQVRDEARRIKSETGRTSFNQGDQITRNGDGSYTIRNENQKKAGEFSETTYKGGQKTATRTGDGKGNWNETQYDAKGNKTGSTEHKQGADGASFSERHLDAAGKEKSRIDRTTNPDGSYKERTSYPQEGRSNEVSIDKNGKVTGSSERQEKGPNDYTEQNYDADHKLISTKTRTPDGKGGYSEKTVTPDKPNHESTTSYDANGKPTGRTERDNDPYHKGSYSEERFDAGDPPKKLATVRHREETGRGVTTEIDEVTKRQTTTVFRTINGERVVTRRS